MCPSVQCTRAARSGKDLPRGVNAMFAILTLALTLALAGAYGFLGFGGARSGDFGDVGLGGADVELLAQLGVDLGEDLRVVFEESPGVFAPLPDALAGVAVPGAGLLDDVVGHGQVEHVALAADAFAIEDVELGFAEGSGNFVFDDLDLGAIAGDGVAVLDGGDAADIDADRGVELEGAATGGGFRIAEHDADLLADLVDEDECGAGLGDGAGELAQGLGHQARLEAHVGVAHFAVEFGLGNKSRHGVDDQHVDGAGPDQGFSDFKGLLATIWLRNQQVVDIDAKLLGVAGIESVFGVDEGGQTAQALGFGDDLEGDGRLARRFRAKDLCDAAAGDAADAESGVKADRAGRDNRYG